MAGCDLPGAEPGAASHPQFTPRAQSDYLFVDAAGGVLVVVEEELAGLSQPTNIKQAASANNESSFIFLCINLSFLCPFLLGQVGFAAGLY